MAEAQSTESATAATFTKILRQKTMDVFLAALVLAILIEGTLTYIFGESSDEPSRPGIRYFSLAIGMGAAILYQIDILGALGVNAVFPWVGYLTSGLIIGRGSNYVNDFVSKLRN